MEAFLQIIEPLQNARDANERENGTLACTRDVLLPKLLSGELRVKDADKMVEAAL